MTTEQKQQAEIFAQLLDHLPDEKFAKPQLQAGIEPNIDLSEAFKQTLAAPEYYPPLSETVFPGDSIAIALQTNLPHPRQVLSALIEHLGSLSVALSDIVVVVTRPMADRLGLDPKHYEIPDENKTEGKRPAVFPVEFEFNAINFQVHDPENRAGNSYLVANAEGDPVHVNRILVDADLVLPIGCPIPGDSSHQVDCVYPDFSTEATRHRFSQGKGSFVSRWTEIELANDTLGSFFAIQVVCGPGDSIRQICSGARKDAIHSARTATNELWAFDWPTKSDAVVATIESNPRDQSWDDVANALVAASRVSRTDGPIIVWSDISVNPDRNFRKACMSQFEDSVSAKLTKTLQLVATILKDRPVYLRSELNRSQVEELGMGFVEAASEVLRIADPYSTALVIRDAHKCQIRGEQDGDQLVEESQ